MKVLLFGKLPPPIGGVTVSVKNLVKALSTKGVDTIFFGRKMRFQRYDIAHIHYSNLLKRLLGVVVAKVFARKVIFTVHGKFLDMNNVYNKLSVKISDGVIVLNEQLYAELKDQNVQTECTILPSIFAEGFDAQTSDDRYFERETGLKYLLLYACDRNYRDGEEVYGVSFVLHILPDLSSNYRLVLLDISGKYRDDIKSLKQNVVYIDHEVNFIALLRQVDLYLRPTYMDGASVAVQEALFLNVPVLASDVVDRPQGTNIYQYKNTEDFIEKLQRSLISDKPSMTLTSVQDYIDFCNKLLDIPLHNKKVS